MIDDAVTESYRQQEIYEARNQIEVLNNLCSKMVAGMSKSEAIDLLNELSPDFKAYEKEGKLNTIWLSFEISEEGIVASNGACY